MVLRRAATRCEASAGEAVDDPLDQMAQQAGLRPDARPWIDNERWNEQRERLGR